MRHTLISITKRKWSTGYELAVKPAAGKKSRPRVGHDAGNSPEEAAATAVSEAIGAAGPFMIFAPPEVLKHIPPEYRKSEQ